MTIKEVSEKYEISSDTLRYYERVGMIPPVERTEGGMRNYGEDDIKWVEHVLRMCSAGLPIEAIIEYVRLSRLGDSTFKACLELLSKQREALISQKEKIFLVLFFDQLLFIKLLAFKKVGTSSIPKKNSKLLITGLT